MSKKTCPTCELHAVLGTACTSCGATFPARPTTPSPSSSPVDKLMTTAARMLALHHRLIAQDGHHGLGGGSILWEELETDLAAYRDAQRMGQPSPTPADEQEADELVTLVTHATALSQAARWALDTFGDEGLAAVVELRRAVEAFEKWLVTETPGRKEPTEHGRMDEVRSIENADERFFYNRIIDRYQACVARLWERFPKDPLPANHPAQTWCERLEALVELGLIGPYLT